MPQTVLIMTDTQRTDMVGCYGNRDMKTPNIDRIAAGGIRFDRAYTCQPVCGPARAALFTGTYPHSNGSWANSMPLGDNVKTVGQRLRDRGVRTAYIGKWHLDGGDYFGLGRCPDGWDPDFWYDMRCYLEELRPEERRASRDPTMTDRGEVAEEFTFGYRVARRAVDFLERHGDEDFLLVVSFDEPHHPFLCPEPFASMYREYELPGSANLRDPLSDKPPHLKAWAGAYPLADAVHVRHPRYFGCNSFVDHEVGRVLDAIDRIAPGARLIYTSDHGDALGSHRIHGKGPTIYDEVTRIPLIMREPGSARAGTACPHPVSHVDVVPTILEHFGVPVPRLLEGRSLAPCLRDAAARVNEAVFIEFGRYEIDHDGFGGFQPLRCVFDGRYKLGINLLSTDELYDLEADPAETVNLIEAPRCARVRDRLHDLLLDWMNRTRDPFRGCHWERRPWRADARPATWGYTGMTRQRENEEYEPRQLDYDTGLPMTEAVRKK